MNREKVSQIIKEIGKLEQSHCEGCEIVTKYREQSQTGPTHLCVSECPIGKQIRELGKELEKLETTHKNTPKQHRGRKALFIKEELAEMVKTMTGKEIAEKCHVAPQSVSYYIKKYKLKPFDWRKRA